MMAKLLEPDSALSCRVNFGLSGTQNSEPTSLVLNHNYNFDWFSMSQRLSQLVGVWVNFSHTEQNSVQNNTKGVDPC